MARSPLPIPASTKVLIGISSPTIAEVGERTGTLSEQMKRTGSDYFRDHEQFAQLASTATEIVFISLVACGISAMVLVLWITFVRKYQSDGTLTRK